LCCVCLIGACFGFFVVQDLFASNLSEWRYILRSHVHLKLSGPKKLLILSVNGVLAISLNSIFCKGMFECLEEILIRAKSKWELEWNIFLFMHLKTFTLQFGLVWNYRMCLRFFQCWFKICSWINYLYFGTRTMVKDFSSNFS
jgi:hypothetical protein